MYIIIAILMLFFIIKIIRNVNVKNLNGKSQNYQYLVFTSILKMILLFWVISRVSDVWNEAVEIYEINQSNIEVGKKIKDYYCFPLVRGSDYIDENNQMDYNARLDGFYEDVVDEYDAIIMDSSNYAVYGLHGKSMAEKYDQIRVTVNMNYLKINPIHDTHGNLIDESYMEQGSLNILIPDFMNADEVIKNEYSYLNSIGCSFHVISYKTGETIRAFNPYVGMDNYGWIDNPVIDIYDSGIQWGQMLNYVSQRQFFIKLQGEEPYEEIKPLLEKHGLAGALLVAEPVSNVYDNSIALIAKKMRKDVMEIFIYLISLVIIIYYYCRNYFQLNEKKILIKRISGFGTIHLFAIPVIFSVVQFLILLTLSIWLPINRMIILIMTCFEIFEIIISTFWLLRKNIVSITKGEGV